jgi:replicative DNA helicase
MIAPATARKRRPSTTDPEAIMAPLYSAEAEKAVLGSMLARPDVVIDEVSDGLAKDDFFVPSHQEIYEAINALHNSGKAIDITTLHQYLADRKLAEVVGSPGILAELAAGLATHLNVGSYVSIVKEKSLLRHLQHACANISQSVQDNQDSVTGVLDNAEREIFQVTNRGLTNSTVTAKTEIEKAIQLIENYQKNRGRLFGIPTGFHRLNELTTGWHGGEMIVLAARPGIGKTALALTFARHAMDARYDEKLDNWVKPGYCVGMFSLEMTNQQLMLRMLASYASESLQRIRQGDLDDQAMQKLCMIGEDMKQFPLVLDDSSFLTINQLRGKTRRMKQQYKIDMLVIDYLQLLRSESEQAKDNRQNEVAEISRGIKALAKELDIPIIVLAQLNRKSEEGKTEPALHNLRESGAIEQDADMVLLLHREDGADSEESNGAALPPGVKKYKLIIAKQRNGPTDNLEIHFQSNYTRFEDPVRHEA